MANAFTSTALIASLKRRGLIPTTASTFTADDFHKIVDDETQTYCVPLLMSVREEYLVTDETVTAISGTTEYYIPERAIGSSVREVKLGGRKLTRLEPERIDENQSVGGSYYLEGNRIVLTGGTTSESLTVAYCQRPGRIVATTAVGEITAINTATSTCTISTAPSTFTTSVTYDFVKGKSGFDTLGKDYSASVAGTTMTFTSSPPTGLAVGDFICLAQETPIPQIPVELHPLLAQRVTATVLHALGDAKAEAAYKVASDMEARILKLITPRTQGSRRVYVNKYGVGSGRNQGKGMGTAFIVTPGTGTGGLY